jgi:hypothetical protein
MKASYRKKSTRIIYRKLWPGSDFSDRFIVSTAIAIVLFSFLFMISGCSYYKLTTRPYDQSDTFFSDMADDFYKKWQYPREDYPEERLVKLLFLERDFYVFDPSGRWHLHGPELIGDTIISQAQLSPVPEGVVDGAVETRKNKRYYPEKESDIIRRINLYVDKLNFNDSGMAYIPVSGIQKCEIYKKDHGKTTGKVLGTFFIVAGAVFMVTLLIVALTSCPFVYVFDGNAYQFAGEIYGGAVYPSLERDDYLALPKYECIPGSEYKIKLANMLEEIQYINQADLLILTHDSSFYPLIDKYGRVQTVSKPILPYSAIDSKGNDCLGEITGKDKLTHDFCEDLDTTMSSNYLNSLDLTFKSNSNPDSAKLFINGKNSLWGDYMIRQFFNLFGSRYQKFVRRQEDKPAIYHQQWMQQQGLLLQVFIMKDGEWVQADYFNMVGALGSRDMVLPLDLENAWSAENSNGTSEYTLRVKLVSGYLFWEVDYAVIDLTDNEKVEMIWLPADHADDQNGRSVMNLLASDDDRYLVQKETGDEVILDFTMPVDIDNSFTLYLHSKGYYQQAGKNNNEPDITLLETFREPGRLSHWSSRKFSEAASAFQTRLDGEDQDE